MLARSKRRWRAMRSPPIRPKPAFISSRSSFTELSIFPSTLSNRLSTSLNRSSTLSNRLSTPVNRSSTFAKPTSTFLSSSWRRSSLHFSLGTITAILAQPFVCIQFSRPGRPDLSGDPRRRQRTCGAQNANSQQRKARGIETPDGGHCPGRQGVPELEDVGPDQGGEARDQGGEDPRA